MTALLRLSVLGLVILASGSVTSADERSTMPDLDMRVTPTYSRSPATVQATVFVQRDGSNRALRVTVDSGAFFRSSAVELDGAAAPRTHVFRWSSLPPGTYQILVELRGTENRHLLLRREIRVIGLE